MIKYDLQARRQYGKDELGRMVTLPIPDEVVNGYLEQVKALSNMDLLYSYTDFAGGDDYDGCHTYHGQEVYNLLSNELYFRLRDHGFLEE